MTDRRRRGLDQTTLHKRKKKRGEHLGNKEDNAKAAKTRPQIRGKSRHMERRGRLLWRIFGQKKIATHRKKRSRRAKETHNTTPEKRPGNKVTKRAVGLEFRGGQIRPPSPEEIQIGGLV